MTMTRRHALRWSVRALGLGVAAAGCWLGWNERRAARQRRAVDSALRAGGNVVYYPPGADAGRGLYATAERGSDVDWTHRVGEVYLAETRCKDYSFLRDLADAEVVSLRACETFGDPDLTYLQHFSRLRLLELSGLNVSASSLETLSDLPELNTILLEDMPLSDEVLRSVGGLSSLKALALQNTLVTALGLAALRASRPDIEVLSR